MSDQIQFEVKLYSPRWGREDTYQVALERKQMSVKVAGKWAVCCWVENADPEWSGYNAVVGNPLEQMLMNDGICPPSVFARALQRAWEAWREGTLSADQIKSEVEELCKWVNTVTRSRPTTDFWRGVF